MPFVDQFGEVVYKFALEDDPENMLVTCGIGFTAGVDAALAQTTLAAWITAWSTHLRSSLSSDYKLASATIRVHDGAVEWFFENAVNLAGTGGTGILPQNCALLVRKLSGVAGRKFRGRFYWPGMLGEANVSPQGMITSSVVTTLQGHFTDWFDDVNTAGSIPVINHEDLSFPTAISELIVESRIATQRRRLRP